MIEPQEILLHRQAMRLRFSQAVRESFEFDELDFDADILERLTKHEASKLDAQAPDTAKSDVVPGIERVYIELLGTFAAKLHAEGHPRPEFPCQ